MRMGGNSREIGSVGDGVVGDEKGFGLGMFLNKRERCRRMFLCGCRWK